MIDSRRAGAGDAEDRIGEVVDARCNNLTNCTCTDCPIPFAEMGGP